MEAAASLSEVERAEEVLARWSGWLCSGLGGRAEWVREFFHPDTLREVLAAFQILQAREDYFLMTSLLGISPSRATGVPLLSGAPCALPAEAQVPARSLPGNVCLSRPAFPSAGQRCVEPTVVPGSRRIGRQRGFRCCGSGNGMHLGPFADEERGYQSSPGPALLWGRLDYPTVIFVCAGGSWGGRELEAGWDVLAWTGQARERVLFLPRWRRWPGPKMASGVLESPGASPGWPLPPWGRCGSATGKNPTGTARKSLGPVGPGSDRRDSLPARRSKRDRLSPRKGARRRPKSDEFRGAPGPGKRESTCGGVPWPKVPKKAYPQGPGFAFTPRG